MTTSEKYPAPGHRAATTDDYFKAAEKLWDDARIELKRLGVSTRALHKIEGRWLDIEDLKDSGKKLPRAKKSAAKK